MKPSKIVNGIFQGGYPLHNPAEDGFDALVLCAEEFQPDETHFPGVVVVHAPMTDDVIDLETVETASRAAAAVAELIRRGSVKRVLVTCAVGRNRSGLVTGLILHDLYGISGDALVDLIRERRPGALSNMSFAEFLSDLPSTLEKRYA